MASDGPRNLKFLNLLWVGWVLVLCIVLGYFVGTWIDGELDSAPWGVAIGVILGAAAGFVELFRTVSRSLK